MQNYKYQIYRVEEWSKEKDEEIDDAPEEIGYQTQPHGSGVENSTVWGDVNHRGIGDEEGTRLKIMRFDKLNNEVIGQLATRTTGHTASAGLVFCFASRHES